MYKIIAPTLFQNKICRLPGIGTLRMVAHPAESDFINTCIKAPGETIEFIVGSDGGNVFTEFTAISELLKKRLDESGYYLLNGIGTFIKENSGEIRFVPFPVDPIFTSSIAAERVIRQDTTHAILVGENQTTNVKMVEYYGQQKPLKAQWWVWAIVLATLGIGILLFHIFKYGLNAFGNMNYF